MRPIYQHVLPLAAVSLVAWGCANQQDGETVAKPDAAASTHAHGGPNGGTVADWGGGKYHVEFTVDHDNQQATVYVLADDAATPAPIRADALLLSIREPSFQVELAPAPLDGEEENTASRFVGEHKNLGIVREFAGTISSEVDGTPYAGDFSEQAAHSHEQE